MSVGIKVEVKDDVSESLEGLAKQVGSPSAEEIAGKSLVNLLRAHFYKLDSDRANKLGGRRTHFYGVAARGTSFAIPSAGSVLVSVAQLGIRQRRFGGEIKPTGGRTFLTIPAIAEAYAQRAEGDFRQDVHHGQNKLVFAFAPDPNRGGKLCPALVEAAATTLKKSRRKGDRGKLVKNQEVGGKVFYWLVRRVNQKPDETVLPHDEIMLGWVMSDLKRAAERKGGG